MSYGPEEGNDHTCPDCGAKWWDSDGGCSCTTCRHCGSAGDEDFAPDGYCADCKDAEIDRLNADILRIYANYEDLAKIALNSDRERIELHNRIRALEFQNAELRAKA